MTRRSASIVALVGLVVLGCSMPLHYFAFPPGRTQQDFERDARVCNLDAQTLQWNTWFGGRMPSQIDRRFVECMTKLGYTVGPSRRAEAPPVDLPQRFDPPPPGPVLPPPPVK